MAAKKKTNAKTEPKPQRKTFYIRSNGDELDVYETLEDAWDGGYEIGDEVSEVVVTATYKIELIHTLANN